LGPHVPNKNRTHPRSQPFLQIEISPDGTRIVALSSGDAMYVFDGATGGEIRRLTSDAEYLISLATSPDGTRIAAGAAAEEYSYGAGDGTARIWDMAMGDEMARLTGHAGNVRAIAFSKDGARVVTDRPTKPCASGASSEGQSLPAWKATRRT